MNTLFIGVLLLIRSQVGYGEYPQQQQKSFDDFKVEVPRQQPPAVPTVESRVWRERCQGDYACPRGTVRVCNEHGAWVCVEYRGY